MKFQGRYLLPAPPTKVWDLLADPSRWSKLLPGSERLVPDGPDRYKVSINSGTGTIEFADKNPPESMLVKLAGKAFLGSINVTVQIDLADQQGHTELRYTGDAQMGGMMAAVGQSTMASTAQKIMDQAFAAVAEELKRA